MDTLSTNINTLFNTLRLVNVPMMALRVKGKVALTTAKINICYVVSLRKCYGKDRFKGLEGA